MSERAGRYAMQPGGYRAFLPRSLPPDPPLQMSDTLLQALSLADQALGRLDGAADILPDPDLFVFMFVRKEAVLSSEIEGTRATLIDVLEYEAGHVRQGRAQDALEVVNYIQALNHGLRRIGEIPVSQRLIREIHAELMRGVRGSNRQPGEFRTTQNWIGRPHATLSEADFVPPPPHHLPESLGTFERFLHLQDRLPVLLRVGLAHAQFETIHPFLDGNGRIGRLLISLLLCERGVLRRPLLYLSNFFRREQVRYYERLQAVRDRGDWEGWLAFFLQGVAEVAGSAAATARQVLALRERHRQDIAQQLGARAGRGQQLLDALFRRPVIDVRSVAEATSLTYAAANQLTAEFERLGVLVETTGQRRHRRFSYAPYLQLFH